MQNSKFLDCYQSNKNAFVYAIVTRLGKNMQLAYRFILREWQRTTLVDEDIFNSGFLRGSGGGVRNGSWLCYRIGPAVYKQFCPTERTLTHIFRDPMWEIIWLIFTSDVCRIVFLLCMKWKKKSLFTMLNSQCWVR